MYALLLLLALFKAPLVWFSLFVVGYAYFFRRSVLMPTIAVFGLVYDVFWVFPLGYTSLFLTIFWLLLELYAKKYNASSPLFLGIYLFAAFLLAVVYFELSFSLTYLVFFLALYIALIVQTKVIFQNSGESLVGKKIRV